MAVIAAGSAQATMEAYDIVPPGGVFTAMSHRHVVNESFSKAGYLRRFFAYMIDLWISNILFVIGLVMFFIGLVNLVSDDGGGGQMGMALLLMAASPLVPGLLAGLFGRTPGKAVFGIKVTNLDSSDMSRLKLFFREVFRFYLIGLISLVTFYIVFAIDVLLPLFDKNGQSLHDKIFFNTIVVKT